MDDDVKRDTGDAPHNPNATRDHLANERTFLAWVRSCIAIMALGFVAARFGLLLRELGSHAPRHTPLGLSTGFGVALVVCSAVLVALATLRYRDATHAIDQNTYHPSAGLILLLSGGSVLVAALLAVYLLTTA
jgi:putative membrane protein